MSEKEPRGFKMETIISSLESTNIPEDLYKAQSLRELYQSGAYRAAATHPNQPGLIKGLRIVRREKQIDHLSSIVFCFEGLEKKNPWVLNTIRRETKILPITSRRMTPDLEHLALNILKEAQLNTVASMAIKESLTSGEQIIEVRYPEVFMNVDPNIPPSQRDRAGLALAMYFLKRVPLK